MLMAIDIGNTQSVIGLYEGQDLQKHWRLATRPERTSDEWGVLMTNLLNQEHIAPEHTIDAAIVSSVVPSLTQVMVRTVEDRFDVKCRVVGPGLKTGMPIHYEDPREVGADRVVNAVAAYSRWRTGLIIIDFGTATTFDVVSNDGGYLGGAICPGIGISSRALFDRAARLPKVEFAPPKSVVGRNTVESIKSGLVFGYVGLVEGLVARIREEMDAPCVVVATGGLAPSIAKETSVIDHIDENLTLEGLRLIHELNR